MKLERIICTTCGNSLEATLDQSAITCDACGNTFLVSNGIDFATKSEKEISGIKKLRNNLQRSVVADDHKNILHFSKEILRLIPKDDLANYYYAYANYTFGSRKYLFDFYSIQVQIPEESDEIINHIIEYSDVRDKSLIEIFISRNNPVKLEKYRERYLQKLVDEEHYSSIPRDIFISFRSTDIEIATKTLETLEKDGYTCWISSRNLRPNDNDNYWFNIEDAITKCSVFLVISSQDAMISRDVKKELDIATKQKKKRLELKIDTVQHTSLFKYFFDGCKWVDGTKNIDGALQELKTRVYDLINEADVQQHTTSSFSGGENEEFTRKMNRVKVELLGKNFEGASNTIKDALGIDPENAEAWWMLFLTENYLVDFEAFHEYIEKNNTLGKLAEMYSKVSYRQYKKHAMQGKPQYPKRIERFEEIIYEEIIKYINLTNLNSKNKKDYLNSYFPNHILTLWAQKIFEQKITSDALVHEAINDDDKIKGLENLFDDLGELQNHLQYDASHIKEYHERFLKNYALALEKRKNNLKTLEDTTNELNKSIIDHLENSDFKTSLEQAKELFYYDNSSPDKYYYLLLGHLKAKNSVVLYTKFKRLNRKKRQKLLQSAIFAKLYESEKYQPLMIDLIHHAYYKTRHKTDRYEIQLRGLFDDMPSMS